MRKNNRLKVPVTVSLDYEYLQEFEKDHKGMLSAQINEMLKDFVTNEKNEQALSVDPLNLRQKGFRSILLRDNTRQSTLFEVFAQRDRRDEINQFVKSVEDTLVLNTIEKNCKAMLGIASTWRRNLVVSKLR